MKIVLINPGLALEKSRSFYRKIVFPILPSGIAYIAGALKKAGFEVEVIDQYAEGLENEQIIEKLRSSFPDIVGFSCLTPNIAVVESLSGMIRSLNGNIKIVLGNIHAAIFSEMLLKAKVADIIVRGEGEISMVEIAQAIERGQKLRHIKGISFIENDSITVNPDRELIHDIDDLAYPAWDLFKLNLYKRHPMVSLNNITLPIQASRGCPYRCIFCAQDTIYKYPRYRKADKVVDEIEYMNKNYGVRNFGFIDAYFPHSIDFGLDFCRELINRGLHNKITWITETRVDKVNLDLLKAMKKTGLRLIMYGVESGNQEVLNKANKSITLDQAREAMKMTKEAGLISFGLFMLGLPGETRSTCEETIRFSQELDFDIAKFNIAVPLPGSQLFQNCKARLKAMDLTNNFSSWANWLSYSADFVDVSNGMDSRELTQLQRKAMFLFFMRPKLIIRYLVKQIMPVEFILFGAYILIRGLFGDKIIGSLRKRSY